MMDKANREEWEFNFPISKVLAGAQAQLDYRKSRVAFWEQEKKDVTAEVTKSGLTVYEPDPEKFSSYSNRQDAEIQMDTNLRKRLTTASQKLRDNQERVQEYKAWVEFLSAGKQDDHLKLKHNDWQFFFGKLR